MVQVLVMVLVPQQERFGVVLFDATKPFGQPFLQRAWLPKENYQTILLEDYL